MCGIAGLLAPEGNLGADARALERLRAAIASLSLSIRFADFLPMPSASSPSCRRR